MPIRDLDAWITRGQAEYERARTAAGEPADVAAEKARASYESAFPDGVPAPNHEIFNVVITVSGAQPQIVGFVWIAPMSTGSSDWWVNDVEISSEHRGKGYGRAAMRLAEEAAAEHGATTLGLNVFGYNTVARRLYEAIGYETIATQMRKKL